MTFNSSQPRVPKGSPGGGRWVQATFSDYEESLDDIIDQLETAMDAGEYEYFGIRVEDVDDPATKGDELPASRVWVDGEPTIETLRGTSTFGLSSARRSDVDRALRAMGLRDDARNGYYGRVIYIVGGDAREHGEDAGEHILKDAKVVTVYTRDDSAFAPVKRRL